MSYLIRHCGHQLSTLRTWCSYGVIERKSPYKYFLAFYYCHFLLGSNSLWRLPKQIPICAGTMFSACVPGPGCSPCSLQQLPWISSLCKPASCQHKGRQKIRSYHTGQGDSFHALLWEFDLTCNCLPSFQETKKHFRSTGCATLSSKYARRSLTMGWLPVQIGDTLEEYLVQATDDAGLRQVLMSMSEAIRTIAFKVGALLLERCYSNLQFQVQRCMQGHEAGAHCLLHALLLVAAAAVEQKLSVSPTLSDTGGILLHVHKGIMATATFPASP